MDQQVEGVASAAQRAGARVAAPRIYYLDPWLAGPLSDWPRAMDRAADLGFTHILIPPPFDGPSLFLPADFERAHPALGWTGDAASALRRLADGARAAGLAPLLDIAPARVSAGGAVARAHPDLFRTRGSGNTLDPRAFDAEGDAAPGRWDDAPDALRAFWVALARTWDGIGLAGFRLLLAGIPPSEAASLAQALRQNTSGPLIGWTPGVPQPDLPLLERAGLDAVASSLPWWDYAADWLWTEAAILRRIAPVIAPVEAPFGPRLAAGFADPHLRAAAQRRALNVAAATGEGVLMPMGFEWGATRTTDPRHGHALEPHADAGIATAIRAANDATRAGVPRLLSGPGEAIAVLLRTDADPRFAKGASLDLVSLDLERRQRVTLGGFLAASGGRFAAAEREDVTLDPAAAERVALSPRRGPVVRGAIAPAAASAAAQASRIGIESVTPSVDGGRFAAKRLAGEVLAVEADLVCDGHDQLAAVVQWRKASDAEWREVRMRPLGNDRWGAAFPLEEMGRYLFRIVAWRDAFATYRDELRKKFEARIDVAVELIEGRRLIEEAGTLLAPLAARVRGADDAAQVALLLAEDTAALMTAADKRPRATRTELEYPVEADRVEAEFASWYEIFPRSMSDDPGRHGTFADVVRHLPRIRDMGFDVLYFPPIHPIGRTNRKGRNNALTAAPDDPGSPYAIGGAEGGYDAIHPQLGTLEDFQMLRDAAARHGLEIALDFAIQCSPDHPWLKQHPKWFAWRPDGSIRYAENPPKKYEDIVNVDFYAPAAIPDLWVALAEVVAFWAEQGVRIFRVDNPHTKPFPFWEWMIAEIRARYPDAIFLAEAFTRPKVMNRLGKIGFTQSYTYFTWRNTKPEIEEYLTELAGPTMREFFRPNFFVNTPDINPIFLQSSGRSGFLIRAALAATLSGSWGVYNGFELCEATPLPGREEYADSEKYQIRAWDWDRPGNIVAEIAQLNLIRRLNPALRTHLGVTFLPADNDHVLFYEKATPDRSNVVFVAVSLDPAAPQGAAVELPLWRWDLPDGAQLAASDLVTDASFTWTGKWQRVTLDPARPYGIWRVRPTAP